MTEILFLSKSWRTIEKQAIMKKSSHIKASKGAATRKSSSSATESSSKFGVLYSLLSHFDPSIVSEYIFDYLFLSDVIHLDTAISCELSRPLFLNILNIYINKLLKRSPLILHSSLKWLINRNTQIQSAKLINFEMEDFMLLMNSTDTLKSLTMLDLTRFEYILTSRDFNLIAYNCPALVELKFPPNIGITDRSLLTLSKYCTELSIIDFGGPPFETYTKKGLQTFIKNCKNIKILRFLFSVFTNQSLLSMITSTGEVCGHLIDTFDFEIDDYFVAEPENIGHNSDPFNNLVLMAEELSKFYPTLKRLYVSVDSETTMIDTTITSYTQFMNIITNTYPTLEILTTDGIPLSTDTVAMFTRLTKLQNLEISDCNLTDAMLIELFPNLPELTSLNIAHNSDLTDASIIALTQNCQKVTELNICGINKLTDISLYTIAEHYTTNLNNIHMSMLPLLTDTGLRTLSQSCINITHIAICNCNFTTKYMIEVCNTLIKLESVYIQSYNKDIILHLLTHNNYKLYNITWEPRDFFSRFVYPITGGGIHGMHGVDSEVQQALRDNHWHIPYSCLVQSYHRRYAYRQAVC